MNATELSEAQREQALTRFTILQPHLEEGCAIHQLAEDAGVSVRTIQRWARAYREHGLSGLARKPRSDRGKHRLPNELVRLIEGLALRRPPPSAATVCRQVQPVVKAQGWPEPTYRSVFNIVSRLDPALVTLAHEGEKAYSSTFDLIYRRAAERPNDIWQADHTLLDIWVRDHRDRPVRPWLTAIMDDFSRGIAGCALNLGAPSALISGGAHPG